MRLRDVFVSVTAVFIIIIILNVEYYNIGNESVDFDELHNSDRPLFLNIKGIPGLIGLGVQKGGSSSFGLTISSFTEIISSINGVPLAMREINFYDQICNSIHDSFNKSVEYILNHQQLPHRISPNAKLIDHKSCNIAYFRQFFYIDNSEFIEEERNNSTKNKIHFEKNPDRFLWPHITLFVVRELLYYGTKAIVLLRDPNMRFISAFWHYHRMQQLELERPSLLLRDINKEKKFKMICDKMETLYDEYTNMTSSKNMEKKLLIKWNLLQIFSEFIYSFVTCQDDKKCSYSHSWFIWIRGCYAPLLLQYVLNINKYIHRNHIFGIIQSEMTFDRVHWIQSVKRMRCFLYYEQNEEYQSFTTFYRNFCASKLDKSTDDLINEGVVKYQHVGQATNYWKEGKIFHKKLAISYRSCNKWLHLLLMENKHLIITEWNERLWIGERLLYHKFV